MEPIDLEPQAEPQASPQVDLNTGNVLQPTLPEHAYTRSVKAYMGLKNKVDKSFQDYYDPISQGEEDPVRQDVSAQLDVKASTANQKAISDIALRAQGNFTPSDMNQIQFYSRTPTTNPNTVFEKHYAQEYMNYLNWPKNPKDNYLNDISSEHPEVEQTYKDIGTELQTRNAILWKEAEDADTAAKAQPWVTDLPVDEFSTLAGATGTDIFGGYIGDKLKENIIPLYYQLLMRSRMGWGSIFSAAGLGKQLEDQSVRLLSMPVDEMQKEYHDLMTDLKERNPSAAVTFAAAMLGQSTSEKTLANALTIGELPVIAGLLSPGVKLAGLGIRAGRGAIVQRQFDNAVKQMVKGAEATPIIPPEVVAPAVAGDLETAATNQVVHNVTERLRGTYDPRKDALDAMTTTLKIHQDEAASNPGNYGQDMSNRLNAVYGDFDKKLTDLVANGTVHIEMGPGPLQIETVVNTAKQEMIDKFPNAANMIMDSSKPYWNPATKSLHVDFNFWDRTGKLFPYEGNADAAARDLGLAPGRVTLRQEENQRFAEATSRIDKQIRDLRREPTGPSMADVDIDAQIKELQAEKEKWMTYHADLLTSGEDVVTQAGPGYRTQNTGAGWYFTITKPIDQTTPNWRSGLLAVNDAVSPQGLLTAITGRARTPDETLSFYQRMNRKIATYAPAKYMEFVKDQTPSIQAIYKGVYKEDPVTGEKRGILRRNVDLGGNRKNIWIEDFERLLELGNTMIDPDTKLTGYSFKNPAEVEYAVRGAFGRSPDPIVVDAYFEWKRVNEMDHMLRNRAVSSYMLRNGTEAHEITVKGPDGEPIKSGFVNAIKLEKFPRGQDTIALIGENKGEENLAFGSDVHATISSRLLDKLTKGVEETREYTALEMWDPAKRELSTFEGAPGVGNHRVRYVVVKTKQLETRPIDYEQLGHRGGGHIEYDYRWALKQAKVAIEQIGNTVKHIYEGDTTLFFAELRALGDHAAEKLNTIRLAFKNKDDAAAKAAAENFKVPYDEVHGWFHDKVDPNGVTVPARLSLHEPIQVVEKDATIIKMDKSALEDRYTGVDGKTTLEDGTRRGSLAEQHKVAFTQERDAEMLNALQKNNVNQALYNVEPARLVDPITMMNRSMQKIVNSTFMDDYKIFSVEHWIKEARSSLDVTDSELLHSPFHYFEHPIYRGSILDPKRIQLETQRLQIKAFIGEPSAIQGGLDFLGQQLADSMYNTGSNTKIAMASGWALSKITRPLDYLRAWVQHSTLGFFNINQIMVQSASWGTIAGVAGTDAAPGFLGALLHQMSRVNSHPNILKALDGIAVKMGAFKPGELLEARDAMLKTGFEQVGAEHVMLNDQFTNFAPKIIQNKFGRFLDAGDMFFKGTERHTRFGAWYTAYKEFRNENPTAPMDNLNLGKILERADLLAGNMSKASRSLMQNGVTAFPLQFLTYQMRLSELFAGKRLDHIERARLFATYGALYGVPATTGLSMVPFGDWWRKSALENGYIVGDNWLRSVFEEGGLATAIAYMTGEGNLTEPSKRIRTGNYYNFSQKLGANGMTWIRDIITSDKAWWKILFGATGSWYENAVQQGSGFYRAMQSFAKDNPDTAFPIMLNDFTDPLKTIAADNNAVRSYLAAKTGVWFGRNANRLMTDVTAGNAFGMWLAGLSPTPVTDIQYATWSKNTRQEAEKAAEREFAIEYRRGITDQHANNTNEAQKHFIRANAIMKMADFPLDRTTQMMEKALEGYESMVWQSRWDMYMGKDVPESQRGPLQKTYERLRQIQQEKQQSTQ